MIPEDAAITNFVRTTTQGPDFAMCSPATKGILLCILGTLSQPRDQITGTAQELARVASASSAELHAAVDQIKRFPGLGFEIREHRAKIPTVATPAHDAQPPSSAPGADDDGACHTDVTPVYTIRYRPFAAADEARKQARQRQNSRRARVKGGADDVGGPARHADVTPVKRPAPARAVFVFSEEEPSGNGDSNRKTKIQSPEKPPREASGDDAVTPMSRAVPRRPAVTPHEPPLPDVLAGEVFKAAWVEFIRHRQEIRKPMTPTAARRQLAELAAWGVERAIAAINHTIARGWQGIREPDVPRTSHPNGVAHAPHRAARAAREFPVQSIQLPDALARWRGQKPPAEPRQPAGQQLLDPAAGPGTPASR